jgi:hypothetical protein
MIRLFGFIMFIFAIYAFFAVKLGFGETEMQGGTTSPQPSPPFGMAEREKVSGRALPFSCLLTPEFCFLFSAFIFCLKPRAS